MGRKEEKQMRFDDIVAKVGTCGKKTVAVAAAQAVEMVGWPESSLILAEAALMVACSPKSNAAYKGINKALEDVRTKKIGKIPSNLKNTDYEGAVKLSPKEAYKYSHDYPNARAEQQYLPDALKDKVYYRFGDNKLEKGAQEYWKKIKNQS